MPMKDDTKQAAHEAVEESLFRPDSNGHTRFSREVHDAVFEEGPNGSPSRFQRELKKGFYNFFGKWFFTGGAAILLLIAGLYYQVQEHEEQLSEGGRYTEQDALEDGRLQEQRDSRQDEDIQNLREEINSKLDRIIDQLLQ